MLDGGLALSSGVRSAVSFLTIIPAGDTDIRDAARYMYIFPLVGLLLGGMVGAFGLGLSWIELDPLIVSLLVAAAIAILTGLHHIDGLGDFADGLMAKGSHAKKISAMRDASTGTAGIFAIVICSVGMISALFLTDGWHLFRSIIVAETTAKFSMVLLASISRSAAAGSGSIFLEAMQDKKKLAAAAAITLCITFLVGGMPAIAAVSTVVLLTVFIAWISQRSMGGVTGDTFGALNEFSRLASILVMVL